MLFGLCIPFWIAGAKFDVELLPGFKLFQAGLAMPMVAALILTLHERGAAGLVALLRRTYDAGKIHPRVWLLPILLVFPSTGFINYWILRWSGTEIPVPTFSLIGLLGYGTVFFMTYGEELGLTGYAVDPMQERYSALTTGVLLGIVWAGYHIPGFVISGYYTAPWSLGVGATFPYQRLNCARLSAGLDRIVEHFVVSAKRSGGAVVQVGRVSSVTTRGQRSLTVGTRGTT